MSSEEATVPVSGSNLHQENMSVNPELQNGTAHPSELGGGGDAPQDSQEKHEPSNDITQNKENIGDINSEDLTNNQNQTGDTGEKNADSEEAVQEKAITKDSECEQEKKEEKKEDEWLDILGNKKLMKKVIQAGQGRDSRPAAGQQVTLKVSGETESGYEIDCHDSLTFILGDGDVIPALDIAVSLMELTEKAAITTDPKYAYGELGRDPDVPKDMALTYDLELLKIEDQIDIDTLPVAERLVAGDAKRERGNYLYARNDQSGAINSYTKALKFLDDSSKNFSEPPEELQKMVDLRLKCYNNLAAAQLKADAWDAALKSCNAVLSVQPENVKALFRKGKCFAGKGNLPEAVTILRKALQIDPETKIIHQELARITKKLKSQEDSQRNMYKKMFGQDKPQTTPQKKTGGSMGSWTLMLGAAAAALLSVGVIAYRRSLLPS